MQFSATFYSICFLQSDLFIVCSGREAKTLMFIASHVDQNKIFSLSVLCLDEVKAIPQNIPKQNGLK